MKNLKKRMTIILSVIIILVVISNLLIINVFAGAENEADFTFDISTGTITQYKGLGGNVVIPSEIEGVSVKCIGNKAFYYCTSVTDVTIPNSVTSIGEFAFQLCSGLTNVTIPNSVTSIGSYAFNTCTSLTNITIPNSVKSIGDYAFQRCTGLTGLTIPNSISSMGVCAFDSTGITSVDIPDGMTSIALCMFSRCFNLSNVTIPNSVTSIDSAAFSKCGKLTNIKIPNSVTSIGTDAFSYTGLTSISIPEGVKFIRAGTFQGCNSLTDVTIPNTITTIEDNAFGFCGKLTSITIPNSVTSIGGFAFMSCSNLTIYGFKGSYAETYARNNNISFIELTTPTDIKDTTVPTSPTSLTTEVKYSTRVVLSWSPSTDNIGVTGYDVYRGDTKVNTVKDTTFIDSGLTASMTYNYTVKARDAQGNISESSTPLAVTTNEMDTQLPSTPTELNWITKTNTAVTLSWTSSTDNETIEGYEIYRGSKKVGTTTGTTFKDIGLNANKLYSYSIKAKDYSGNISSASDVLSVRTSSSADTRAPSKPTSLKAINIYSTGVVLSWASSTDNLGVTGYEIYRGTTKIATVSARTYTDSGLTPQTPYVYTIKARDAAGNVSTSSAELTITTNPID